MIGNYYLQLISKQTTKRLPCFERLMIDCNVNTIQLQPTSLCNWEVLFAFSVAVNSWLSLPHTGTGACVITIRRTFSDDLIFEK